MSTPDTEMVPRLKNEVMSELVYEDDQGLWEPYEQVRTWMGRAEDERVEDDETIAEQALSELHSEGLIFLYRDPSGGRPPDPEPLSNSDARSEIAAAWWRQYPPEPADVWISATRKGQRSVKGHS